MANIYRNYQSNVLGVYLLHNTFRRYSHDECFDSDTSNFAGNSLKVIQVLENFQQLSLENTAIKGNRWLTLGEFEENLWIPLAVQNVCSYFELIDLPFFMRKKKKKKKIALSTLFRFFSPHCSDVTSCDFRRKSM